MRIRGARAAITGGCGGIGLAVARGLLDQGVAVLLVDRDIRPGAALAAENDAVRLLRLDLAESGSVEPRLAETFAAWGAPDILVNAAGISPKFRADGEKIRLWDIGLDDWNAVFAVNLTAAFLAIRAAMPGMKAKGAGRIVNVASLAARVGAENGAAFYTASKAGLIGLTIAAARDLAPFGINVNAVNPGTIDTPIIAAVPAE
ncbi:MAG: SDR family NAD(P)-dependent oxidoreductase [Acetobacterales bacterium]